MIDQETRDLALQTFRDVLTAPDSKPADRLRAAEAIARMDVSEKETGKGSDLDASDEELLKRARGDKNGAEKDAELTAWLTE